jgi:hypothetical protein
MLLMLAVLVVVASIAALLANYFSGKAESQAAQMLGGALKLLSRPVQASTAPRTKPSLRSYPDCARRIPKPERR